MLRVGKSEHHVMAIKWCTEMWVRGEKASAYCAASRLRLL